MRADRAPRRFAHDDDRKIMKIMASEYRKKMISDIWHFCSNCAGWPKDHYIASDDLPKSASMCQECVLRKQRGECH
jgi:hypothetical protein